MSRRSSSFAPGGAPSLLAAWATAGFGLVAAGCMGPEVGREVDTDVGSAHALITVNHRTEAEGTQAAAVAGFARMPAGVDPQSVLTLAGFHVEVPEPGRCLRVTSDLDHHTPLSPIDGVELLEVGDVTITSGVDEAHLAPRAFTGSDVLTGVLYTTRDPSAEPLRPDAPYVVKTTGGSLGPLELAARAPTALTNVTVGGKPLADLETVAVVAPLDLTWSVGSGDSLLYVELAADDGLHMTRCAFADTDGAGTVPGGTHAELGPGTLSVHRLRAQEIDTPNVGGNLSFDLELMVEVEFTR